jgi:hypothetical protein
MKFKLVETGPSFASLDRNFNHFDSIAMLDDLVDTDENPLPVEKIFLP